MAILEVLPSEGRALLGISRREITPPVGIYGRMWGASNHDKSEGTHKALYVTALSIQKSSEDVPAVLVAVDAASLGDLTGREGLWLRARVKTALNLSDSHLMMACSHTHASPWAARSRADLPGGDLIEKYLEVIAVACIDSGREAIHRRQDAIITFATGRCSLAANRDLPDPDNPDRYLTGFNPEAFADDTLLVGRITRVSDQMLMGTIVNYACHPTSLGWDNKLASPDYVGRMREIVEHDTDGVPCLFLQGASGDLAPAHQYESDGAVADHHGEQLGYASLSTLSGMYPAGEAIRFVRAVESGAPLGYWRPEPYSVPSNVRITAAPVSLPAKPWPSVTELDSQLAQATESFSRERIFRKRAIAQLLSGADSVTLNVYGWRIGKIVMVGVQCEVYSIWQRELRQEFPDHAIVAITCVDYEAIGYVIPDELHDLDLYTAWQPPFSKGGMRRLIEGCKKQIIEALKS